MRIIDGKEVNTISEAWDLLPQELKDHSLRVAEYSRIAFAKICSMDLYIGDFKAERELVKDRIENVYQAGLYHDIGKLIPDEDPNLDDSRNEAGELIIPKDHTMHGEELLLELYPNVNRMLVTDKNMIIGGAVDHHERMDGSGSPYGKQKEKISYSGRIVAIADMLDHIAMTALSENPMGEALKALKPLAEAGTIDPFFYKAFTGSGARLKKVFARGAGDDAAAVPAIDTWIRRKSSRPMSLVYQKGELKDRKIYYAEMRFRGYKTNDLRYEEIASTLRKGKLTGHLAEYFTYELLDTLRHFRSCGIETDAMVIYFPDAVMKTFGLAKKIEQALKDENVSPEDMIIVYTHDIRNVKALNDIGVEVLTEVEKDTYMVTEDDIFRSEEAIIDDRIKQMKSERGEEA